MDIAEFMESTSSSSSEEEQLLIVTLSELLEHHQKNELYAENIVDLYIEKIFLEHFKIPRLILRNLAEEFKNSENFANKDTGFERVPAEKCMLAYCWFATHEAASFRDVADRFNIAISTLHNIIVNVTHFISNKSTEIITWPTENEKVQILADFAELGFPDVLGCIDGSHVRIDKPAHDPESYLNRKKYYSIQFQAVCDAKRRIRDIFIGFPGSVHDARVFKNSPLFHTLPNKCGDKFILADSAYSCLRNMLTPYRDSGNLNVIERNFNTKLSHCRIIIEHTFGILKQKFRQLYHLKLRDISLMCHFIRACCVLHNLSLDIQENYENNEQLVDENNEQLVEENDPEINENIEDYNVAGQAFRNYIAALLYNM